MRYVSTRGRAPALSFDKVLLAGLAADGGLYVPEATPVFSAGEMAEMRDLPYAELAIRVMAPFVAGSADEERFPDLVRDAYHDFTHAAVAPLRQVDSDLWLLELFHGPTLAFKDYALQLLGRLFEQSLRRGNRRMAVIGATSGDTGSAAIEACRGRDRADAFILYPHGRISEVQRRQMTTVDDANIHCIAVEGTFDDCQRLVKAMFDDNAFRVSLNLSAVNSINWARIMAQTAYYFYAALRLGAPEQAVSFAVPTGNFGNAFAAWTARNLGLPVERIVVATNRNDILYRFFTTGKMTAGEVHATLSPSMDIQVPSNFERYLFELCGRDGAMCEAAITGLQQNGRLEIPKTAIPGGSMPGTPIEEAGVFSTFRVDDADTRAEIARTWQESGILIDPHTAVGLAAARAAIEEAEEEGFKGKETPMIAQASAHPAKFPEAVHEATGQTPELPAHLKDLMARPERVEILPADLATVQAHIQGHVTTESTA